MSAYIHTVITYFVDCIFVSLKQTFIFITIKRSNKMLYKVHIQPLTSCVLYFSFNTDKHRKRIVLCEEFLQFI